VNGTRETGPAPAPAHFCSSCGASLAAGVRFCAACGATVAQPGVCKEGQTQGTDRAVPGRKCERCGTMMDSAAVKCPQCGSWLKDISNAMNLYRVSAYSGVVLVIAWCYVVFSRILNRDFSSPGEAFSFMWKSPFLWIAIALSVVSLPFYFKVGKRTGMWIWF